MTKSSVKTKSLRGIENCRAVEVGAEKFGECLKQGPSTCAYALPFGYCFLCTNPRLDEILLNTKKDGLFVGVLEQ
ncbi:MAG TPA: hypothetical protein VKP08_16965 [Anaerolineales bacterium]|nr:hypothetical protein [Anaerolineales bacterium]